MPTAKTQRDYRRSMVAVDQYGRRWSFSIELASGDPTGGIRPGGWKDPLRTTEKYLTVPREHGFPVWGRITVDFERWVEDQQAAERDWKVRLWEIGQEKQGSKFDPANADRDDYLLHLVGPKPWPSSVALLEAAAGNPALLGLAPMTRHAREMLNIVAFEDIIGPMKGQTPEPEPEVVRVPAPAPKAVDPAQPIGGGGPTSYQVFVKETMKAGLAKSVKECAVLWQQRKAAMAAAEGEG